VTTCGIMFRVVVAKTAGIASVTVMVSLRPLNVSRTVKVPVTVKSAATKQIGAGATATEAPVIVQGAGVRKLVPVTVTTLPTRAGLGVSVCEICGTTLKKLPAGPPGVHVSVSVSPDWAGTPAPPTLNDPLTVPADTDTV
jgi:hypothetical protein